MADYTNSFISTLSLCDRALASAYPGDPGDDYVSDSDGNVYAIGGVHDNSYAITAYWKSKKLDFGDQYPDIKNHKKTIDKIQLKYYDDYANTPVSIYISTDGLTWDVVHKQLGTGDDVVKVADFHFRNKAQATGRWFFIKIETSSASTSIEWHGLKVYFEPRGEWFGV